MRHGDQMELEAVVISKGLMNTCVLVGTKSKTVCNSC